MYKQIQNLRSENEMYHLNVDEMNALLKCSNDPIYFIETYYHIFSKNGIEIIKLRDYQKEWLTNIHNAVVHNTIKHNYILNAARQLGKTTILSAYLLWYAIFNNNKQILITTYKKEMSIDTLTRIKEAILRLPTWLQPAIAMSEGNSSNWNKSYIKFANGTTITATTLVSQNNIGIKPDFILADEFSFADIETQTEFMNIVFPAIAGSKNSHILMTSTGGNITDPFIKILEKAKTGENSFLFNETAAKDVQYYTKDDIKKMINNYGVEFVLKEFFLDNH